MELSDEEKASWNDLVRAADDKKVSAICNLFIGCKNIDAYGTMMGALAQMVHDNSDSEGDACEIVTHLGKMIHLTVHALFAEKENRNDPNFSNATH